MNQEGYTGQLWKNFLEQLQPFSRDIRGHERHTCDVTSRLGKTGNQPSLHWIGIRSHDDGNRLRRTLRSLHRRPSPGEDDLHPQTNQFLRKFRQPVKFVVGISILDDDVLSLCIAQFPQTLPNYLDSVSVAGERTR